MITGCAINGKWFSFLSALGEYKFGFEHKISHQQWKEQFSFSFFSPSLLHENSCWLHGDSDIERGKTNIMQSKIMCLENTVITHSS